MRNFRGTVKSGYGVAAANLKPVLRLIELLEKIVKAKYHPTTLFRRNQNIKP
jgi:hypothetical protein